VADDSGLSVDALGGMPGVLSARWAGVHGDEYEGPRALWEVCETLPPSSLSGVFVAMPVCNPWAYAAACRATPPHLDGVNLARTFPGDANGTPTQRLAAALLAWVVRLQPALFLDLHSGSIRCRYHPMVGYRRGLGDEARARAAARAFGIRTLWELKDHKGTFNSETARLGIPTVGVEMTGAGGALEADIATDHAGILNLLRWLTVLRDRPAPEVAGPFRRLTELTAPAGGYAQPLRDLGDEVGSGEALVRVLNEFGDTVTVVESPHAGTVWVMRHLRRVDPGELVCAVAERAAAGQG
jgi:predicted deacylase